MSTFEIIVLIVGFILLVLGILSGAKLYQKASMGNSDIDNSSSILTMWSLFLAGISIGLLLIWVVLP